MLRNEVDMPCHPVCRIGNEVKIMLQLNMQKYFTQMKVNKFSRYGFVFLRCWLTYINFVGGFSGNGIC